MSGGPFHTMDVTKVVALVNPKSGERASASFLFNELSRILNGRVVDLSLCFQDQTAAITLIQTHALGGIVVVGGGDGTVSFAMDIVDKINWTLVGEDKKPHITVIPMGTGNDLSRALGFGGGFAHVKCCCGCCACCRYTVLDDVLREAVQAPHGKMDRWAIQLIAGSGAIIDSRVMNNYYSIGFDANIAKKFDVFRKKHPGWCQSRLMNKAWYGCFGMGALCGEPKLGSTVALQIDGVAVPFPQEVKSLIVSNVDSFAGGVKLWKDSERRFQPVSLDDGLVEVQGVYGSFHMGMMQGKMRNAFKIGQGRQVTIIVSAVHFMQWDGEAMDAANQPCTVQISHYSSPQILTNRARLSS